jgi:hypothetical protein
MFRDIVNKLSGGQITAIILALILIPGAVGAAVTFQSVTIVDPASGRQSYIDSGRKLYVYDPVAGYRNNPANMVTIPMDNGGSACETSRQYVVPAGKALIITAISGFEAPGASSSSYSGFLVYDGAGCSGSLVAAHVSSTSNEVTNVAVNVDLGVGIAVKAGKTVSLLSISNFGFTFLHGYLLPASAVPAAATAEAAIDPRPISAAEAAAKLKRYVK